VAELGETDNLGERDALIVDEAEGDGDAIAEKLGEPLDDRDVAGDRVADTEKELRSVPLAEAHWLAETVDVHDDDDENDDRVETDGDAEVLAEKVFMVETDPRGLAGAETDA